MAPIPLKSVVSASSEDLHNPASNLLDCSAGKKWLCCHDNKTRRSEVILELAKRSKITAIEIGNFGSAFVEVLVNNSDSSPDDYITLLPSSMLMSIADSRAGRSRANSVRFGKERLSVTAMNKKWNLVKIKCCQKYNSTEQFGLQRIAFINDLHVSQTPTTPSTNQILSPRTLTPTVSSGNTEPTPHHRVSSLHSSRHSSVRGTRNATEHAQKSKCVTPKRPLREQTLNSAADDQEDYEFAGLEVQSRLFKNCVRATTSSSDGKDEPNGILSRIITDKSKYVDKLKVNSTCSYQRTKLLKKELPKAQGLVDFAETFKCEDSKKGPGVGGAFSRIAAFDNEYEIGEEPEVSWRRNRHKGAKRGARKVSRSGTTNGWMSKRKKIEDVIADIEAVRERACMNSTSDKTTSLVTTPTDDYKTLSLQDIQTNTEKKLANKDENDSDETRTYSWGGSEKETGCAGQPGFVECPLCGVLQPAYAIELHASTCGEEPQITTCFEPICID